MPWLNLGRSLTMFCLRPASSSWYPLLTRVYLSWGRSADSGQRTRNEEKYWNDQYYFNGRVESLQSTYRARIVVTNNSKTDVLTTLLWQWRAASRHCSLHKAARPDSCWVFTQRRKQTLNAKQSSTAPAQHRGDIGDGRWVIYSHRTQYCPAQQTPSSAR